MIRIFFVITLFISVSSLACDEGMFKYSIHSSETNALTEKEFRDTIKNFQLTFSPEVKKKHKADLLVYGQWSSDTVNAYAERDMNAWIITLYGGMARHKQLTMDGLKLILCHELGHHLGGSPKKGTNKWSSAEGQADYFASMKCLRKWWKEEVWEDQNVPDYVISECAESYSQSRDQRLCQRMALAGQSVAMMFQELHQEPLPRFETPDPLRVVRTNPQHSTAQCRLDTYFQGALCSVSEEIDFTYTDESAGACHSRLGDFRGIRPHCWYASNNLYEIL
ncbi:MAG: hypothetical protein NDI69_08465 [Bacteriovoracaceae bacterium]|nr:hypothetical protein [Bacteriovoracaceae bacterium]